MTVGLEVYKSNGSLQFSSENHTHYFVSKGSGSSVTRAFGRTIPSTITITVSKAYNRPVVALACTSGVALYGRSSDATNWYFKYACQGGVGTSYTYYLFQSAYNMGASTFGFDVYAANGGVVFSLAQKPMLMAGVLSSFGASVTAAGRTLAVVPAGWAGWREQWDGWWEQNGIRMIPMDEPPGGGDEWIQYGGYTAKLYGSYVSGSTAYSAEVDWDSVAKLALYNGDMVPINTLPNIFNGVYKPNLVVDVTGY